MAVFCNPLSEDERRLLAVHYDFYRSLDAGKRIPATEAQRHFIAVCRGTASPQTDHERAYLRFKASLTEIICLANSRKHGARCIAGIAPSSGAWLRPVSNLDDGRLERAMRLVDGREPLLGDVLGIPLADAGPDFGFERENRSILPGPWTTVRVASTQEIRTLVSGDGPVLHNDENCVTAEFLASLPFEKRRTLDLVEAGDVSVFSAGPSANGGRKWKVSFSAVNGARMTCMLTDPVLMEKLETGYVPCPHALLTVSLSMPYRPPNWKGEGTPCWKLVAAVIELDATRGARARGARAIRRAPAH